MSIRLQQFLVTALLLCWSRTHAAGFVRDTGDSDQTLSYSPEFEGEESISEEFVNSSKYVSCSVCIFTDLCTCPQCGKVVQNILR